MRWTPPIAIMLAMALTGLPGCEDKVKKLSSSDYLLVKQHETWRNTRKTLQKDQPDLSLFRSIHIFLGGRTRRRAQKDYTGENKQQVLAKLDSLKARYESEILTLFDLGPIVPTLKPGVTLAQLREAFGEVDKEYRQLEAMTAPK